jgi:hypothetical protein
VPVAEQHRKEKATCDLHSETQNTLKKNRCRTAGDISFSLIMVRHTSGPVFLYYFMHEDDERRNVVFLSVIQFYFLYSILWHYLPNKYIRSVQYSLCSWFGMESP